MQHNTQVPVGKHNNRQHASHHEVATDVKQMPIRPIIIIIIIIIIIFVINISMNYVLTGPINNIPALVQIMEWRWLGGKPLSEPMMVSLLMQICVTQPLWVEHRLHSFVSHQCLIDSDSKMSLPVMIRFQYFMVLWNFVHFIFTPNEAPLIGSIYTRI